jgi:hypothetical protein
MTDELDPAPTSAWRLTFRVEDDRVQLVAQERLTMAVLPSEELGRQDARSGFWHELQDSAGRPLYRRVTSNPLSTAVEVPTDDPEQPLAYEQVARPAGTFSVVVPDLPEGRSVALFASRPGDIPIPPRLGPDVLAHPRGFQATEVARFELHREG